VLSISNAVHTEVGGIRFGAHRWFDLYLSWPFATLDLFDDSMTIHASVVFRSWHFELHRSDIRCIRKILGMTGFGIDIEHTNPEIPALLIFWSFKSSSLLRRLRDLGYPVD